MTRNYEKLKFYIESRGGKLLSSSIQNTSTNFDWICNNQHKNKSKMQLLYRKSWCKDCVRLKTKITIIKKLQSKNLKLIEFQYPKCIIQCSNNHIIKMKPVHIVNGVGCGVCFKNNRKISTKRLSIEEVKDRLSKLNIKFMESEHKGIDKRYDLMCEKGHIFNKLLRHVLYEVSGCSYCNNSFKSENRIRKLVEHTTNHKFFKIRPDWLKNPKTGYNLELDGFCKELNLAFEYDGLFHYEVRAGLNNDLEKTKLLDCLKNKLCLEKGIKLIRIPYFMKNDEIINLINSVIN